MSGTLDVLACHAGHTTIQFNKADPIEMDRTRRMIRSLIRMGCVLFIESGDSQIRVYDFDESCDCYIVADVPELKGLADAVHPITDTKIAELPHKNSARDAEAGGGEAPVPNPEHGDKSADSGQGGSAGEGLADAADGQAGRGKGKRGRGRRKVDATKVTGTAVPIQSGG